MKLHLVPFALLTLAACGQPAPNAEANAGGAVAGNAAVSTAPAPASSPRPAPAARASAPADQAAYLGRWVGVEGMVLKVAAKPGGGVAIDNQWDLDHHGSAVGSVTAEGLRWMRNGEPVTAVLTDGEATGLKYLAGKSHCLTVKPGEGYCRD